MKVGVMLTGAIVLVSGALLLTVDLASSSTAGLAYFFVALYALGAIILVWICVFLTLITRKAIREWRV
jgi:hypothetical protein